jgi:glutathione S-transferase
MKLFFSPASPYVRKVMASAHLLGLADGIELQPSAASPVSRDMTFARHNPLGKVPTVILDNALGGWGTPAAVFASEVRAAYLEGGRH